MLGYGHECPLPIFNGSFPLSCMTPCHQWRFVSTLLQTSVTHKNTSFSCQMHPFAVNDDPIFSVARINTVIINHLWQPIMWPPAFVATFFQWCPSLDYFKKKPTHRLHSSFKSMTSLLMHQECSDKPLQTKYQSTAHTYFMSSDLLHHHTMS